MWHMWLLLWLGGALLWRRPPGNDDWICSGCSASAFRSGRDLRSPSGVIGTSIFITTISHITTETTVVAAIPTTVVICVIMFCFIVVVIVSCIYGSRCSCGCSSSSCSCGIRCCRARCI